MNEISAQTDNLHFLGHISPGGVFSVWGGVGWPPPFNSACLDWSAMAQRIFGAGSGFHVE